jgi:peptidoglycan/LPS O-acetylase OafA/YrhL
MKPFTSFSHIGVRGIAALTIVAGHFFTDFAPRLDSRYPTIFVDYLTAVTIFFLLSGVALVQGYHSKELTSKHARNQFWLKRVARIAPMYYFALLLSIAPFWIYVHDTTTRVLSIIFSLLFIQSLTLIGNEW